MYNKGGVVATVRKQTSRPTSTDFIAEWQYQAACVEYDPNLWFPEWPKPNEYHKARRICQGCPVRKECLELALTTNCRYGMFGGLTPQQRDNLQMRRATPIPA